MSGSTIEYREVKNDQLQFVGLDGTICIPSITIMITIQSPLTGNNSVDVLVIERKIHLWLINNLRDGDYKVEGHTTYKKVVTIVRRIMFVNEYDAIRFRMCWENA